MEEFNQIRNQLANELGAPEWTYEDFGALTPADLQKLIDESTLSSRVVGIVRRLHKEHRDAAVAGAGAGNTGGYVLKLRKGRTVIDITANNFAEIRESVISQWPEFEMKAFSLRCGKSSVTNSTTLVDSMEISVSDDCKGFTDFSEDDAMKYASVLSIDENSAIFQQWDGDVSVEVDYLVRDIIRRLLAFDLYSASEYTLREFISPVLVSAAILAKFCKLVAEKQITGTLGNGPVDYIAEYQKFCVLLTEAKQEKPHIGVIQNLVQIAASREMFRSQITSNKRVRDLGDDTQNLPSSGIVSTGAEWIFSRYIFADGEWKFYRSLPLPLTLSVDAANHQALQWKETQSSSSSRKSYEETLKWELTIILKTIVGVLMYQKEKVDEYMLPKRQRTNSASV